jgi:flagellar protein FliO/FliZ
MELLRSPRGKLLLAGALILALVFLAPSGSHAASVSRWVLAAAALGGLVLWTNRSRSAEDGAIPANRLRVISRAGLSQRCGMALVEADGRSYLVIHGDGFAELREAPALSATPLDVRRTGGRRRPFAGRGRAP